MKALENYINEKNRWAAMFKKDPIPFPPSRDEAVDLLDSVDCDLSPENLHCDGEISAAQARKKFVQLKKVEEQLHKIIS